MMNDNVYWYVDDKITLVIKATATFLKETHLETMPTYQTG